MKLISLAILLISAHSFDCHHGRLISNSRLNFFDIELLRYVSEGKTGNVMVSPASIKTTLAMLLEGANDETATEIRSTLRLSSDAIDRKMEMNSYLNALRQNEKSTVLQSANGVFVSNKLTLKKNYEDIIKTVFSSELSKVDFNDPKKASDLINTWIGQKTHGLIPTIVEPEQLTAASQIILTNALYFKSTWKFAFDPRRTFGDCFYRSDVCEKVAMMDLETELPYAYVRDLRAHAIELPYEGGRYSMILLVPLDRAGCEALIRDLPFISLANIHDMMRPTDVTLTMPRFAVNYNSDLVEPLTKMHITSLFSTKSNLSGIFQDSTASASVSNFQHKVFMSVDEEGTIAAAASAAVVVPLSFSGVEVKVDKPFVFFIRDNEHGIVLFEGKIEEPTPYVEPVPVKVFLSPSKPQPEQVKTVTLDNVKPINNGVTEPPTPPAIVLRGSYDSPTTEKSNGFFSSVKKLFG